MKNRNGLGNIVGNFVEDAATAMVIHMSHREQPRVMQTMLYYKGKQYHYTDITKVKIYAGYMVRVYINGKSAFWITAEFDNYYKFIEWVRKCNLPIEGEKRLGKSKKEKVQYNPHDALPAKYILILIAIIVVCTVIAFILVWADQIV